MEKLNLGTQSFFSSEALGVKRICEDLRVSCKMGMHGSAHSPVGCSRIKHVTLLLHCFPWRERSVTISYIAEDLP